MSFDAYNFLKEETNLSEKLNELSIHFNSDPIEFLLLNSNVFDKIDELVKNFENEVFRLRYDVLLLEKESCEKDIQILDLKNKAILEKLDKLKK